MSNETTAAIDNCSRRKIQKANTPGGEDERTGSKDNKQSKLKSRKKIGTILCNSPSDSPNAKTGRIGRSAIERLQPSKVTKGRKGSIFHERNGTIVHDSSAQNGRKPTKRDKLVESKDKLELSGELLSKSNSFQDQIMLKESDTPPEPVYKDNCWYPTNITQLAKFIVSREKIQMEKPDFKFEFSKEAAEENWKLFENKYKKNLGKAIDGNNRTQMGYGSEFRKPELLELILKRHPLWEKTKKFLQSGVEYPLEELNYKDRKRDLVDALEFGNHKGVSKNQQLFEETMRDEVESGWSLIIPRERALEISGGLMSPMNIHAQSSINEAGEIIAKDRLTHNQSKKFSSGTSVNSRVRTDELMEIMYGSCLSRVIHYIVALRLEYPDTRVLIQKIDWKAAYRRGHLHWSTAIQTMTQDAVNEFVFIALWMTFGGAANPYFWGEISEVVIDIANALLQSDDWDPDEFHSPLQHLLPHTVADYEGAAELPPARALPLAVDIATNNGSSKADIYIDDGTTIMLDDERNRKKGVSAVLLAIHIFGRAFDELDPLKRKDLVSLSKLEAEGRLEETKILLGWRLDTRRLQVSLPEHKYIAWSTIIKNMIKTGKSNFDELESTLGRLAHVFTIIPYMKHFTSRIRYEMMRSSNRRNKKGIKLGKEAVEDLNLHLGFLKKAKEGISMNILTYRKPTHMYRSDACPAGIGGFSAQGRAWRWELPADLRFRATLNMLEHVAAIVGPWIDIIEGNLPRFSCILSMTDSTTAAGWLRKSKFSNLKEEDEKLVSAKLDLARSHASRLLENDCCDYSQWFPGEDNELSDSLSRDFHLSDDELTKLYFSKIPLQTPRGLVISPLPKEIDLYLCSMLRQLQEKTQPHEKHKHSSLALGKDGRSSCSESGSGMPSSTVSPAEKDQSCCQPLPSQSETEIFRREMANPWFAQLSEQPWTTYLRPSEITTEATLGSTKTRTLAEFYNNNSKGTGTQTPQNNTRRQSL